MAKPSFVKQRYEEIESIRSYLFPAQLRGARKGELARLSNSLFLTPNEQVRYWRLLAEELGSVDAILRDPEEKLMMEFKRQKAVPGFEDLQSRVEVLHQLKVEQLPVDIEQIRSNDKETFFAVLKYYFAKGDRKTYLRIIVQGLEHSKFQDYEWVLRFLLRSQNLENIKPSLDSKLLMQKFEAMEENLERW